ncbi:MAG TPA: hypothetical protein DCM08_03840, partial [Microscillaceae bacterium]|nr:hypothetical protein [Microscillaceae bacterium]
MLLKTPAKFLGIESAVRFIKILLFFGCLCACFHWSSSDVFAQIDLQFADCEEILDHAQTVFNEGRIQDVNTILNDSCLKRLPKAKRIEGLHLLVDTYLYLNEPDQAQKWIIELLKVDPEYQIKSGDVAEFRELYQTIRTTPVFIAGLHLGANFSSILPLKTFSVDNPDEAKGTYTNNLSFQIGLTALVPLTRRIELGAEINLLGRSYRYSNTLFNFAKLNFSENQLLFDVPVFAKFYFGDKYTYKNPLNIYVYAGVAAHVAFSATANVTRNDILNTGQQLVAGPAVNVLPLRNAFTYSVLGGFGLEYKRGRGSFVADIRYTLGLNNFVNPENRYLNTSGLINAYGYLSSDFIFNA